ncbi:hypothetical protein OG203_15515 [Nocardia sp. NBC_01499]|uniref:hypothetical protein n=1 Tax=Nocardia sp. NBC_01499 TaxID=2903597 RepID=UPI00386C9F58
MASADANRIHRVNERAPIAGVDAGREFHYRPIKQLAQWFSRTSGRAEYGAFRGASTGVGFVERFELGP